MAEQKKDFPRSQHYTPSAELLERYKKGFTSTGAEWRPTLTDDQIVKRLRERYANTPEGAEKQGQADADEA